MKRIFEQLRNKLIVSCQAEEGSPFNTPEGISMFALAAQSGGAAAIRSEGYEKTKRIIESVSIPVIGLIKSKFDDGFVCITRSTKEVEELLRIGSSIIAIDGTFRKKEFLSGPEFIRMIKAEFDCIVMADIATVEEAIASAEAGADCISSTLSGYTQETLKNKNEDPDFQLVSSLSEKLSIPVFAEGRINNPGYARRMIELGAWGVVVGTAITRPSVITEWFSSSLSSDKIK